MTSATDTHYRSLLLATLESLEALHAFAVDCEDVTPEDLAGCLDDIINDVKFLDLTAGGM